MITLGVDLSSMPEGTAVCRIFWKKKRAVAELPVRPCTDQDLDHLIRGIAGLPRADVIGIDAPFGWPDAFVSAVTNWNIDLWDEEVRDHLRFRKTDFVVREHPKLWPLSVSSDRIALPAMRAMALLRRHNVTDRSGDKRFFEVYPAGSLCCWKFPFREYKKDVEKCRGIRNQIINQLRNNLPWLEVPEKYSESADSLDALIASLTARAAWQDLTITPTSDQLESAQREGWIHLPTCLPRL